MSRRRWPQAEAASWSGLEKEPRQIPHAMKDSHNHNRLAPRLVEDKVVPEPRHRPRPNADKLAEAALGTNLVVLGNDFESFFRRVEQPVGRKRVVTRDIPPVAFQVEPGARLDQVIHRRREPFLCSPCSSLRRLRQKPG